MLVPDVSRVYRRPYVGVTEHMELVSELFNRPRTTNVYVYSRPVDTLVTAHDQKSLSLPTTKIQKAIQNNKNGVVCGS